MTWPSLLFAVELTVFFLHGDIAFRTSESAIHSSDLSIGQIIDSELYPTIELKPDSYLFFKHQSKCYKFDKAGTNDLTAALENQNSFLCKADLFLKKVFAPRVVADEYLARGTVDEGLSSDDEYFEAVWRSMIQGTRNRSGRLPQLIVGTAAHFQKRNKWSRVTYLMSLLSNEYPFFEDILLDAWRKTTPEEVEAEILKTKADIRNEFPQLENIALLIGINRYKDVSWQDLDNPVNDIEEVGRLLVENYGFSENNVMYLKNAGNRAIFEAFDTISRRSDRNTNLLIYYAGHGFYQRSNRTGYWVPGDAGDKESRTGFIDTHAILERINSISSRHTLLVADACFSGDLIEKTRGDMAPSSRYFLSLSKKHSRQIITAGSLEYVADRGKGKRHSVFAEELIGILSSPRKTPLSASELALQLRKNVKNAGSEQTPAYGRLPGNNEKNGEFFFVGNEQSISDYGEQRSLAEGQNVRPQVLVFDLESKNLNKERRTALSTVFRSILAENGTFDIMDNSEVEKANASEVEQTGKCVGDRCAIAIGERLNADTVVSSSLYQYDDSLHYLSARMLNVKDGSILAFKMLKHRSGIAELDRSMAKLAHMLAGTSGRLTVASIPTDAVLFLDDKRLEEPSDVTLTNVPPGIHTLTLVKDNVGSVQTFQLEPGEDKTLSFKLKPVFFKWLAISTPQGAEIFVDGAYQGRTPATVESTPGNHRLVLRLPGFITAYEEFAVTPFEKNKVEVTLNRFVPFEITVSPPDSQIEIDGETIPGNDPPVTYETVHEMQHYSLFRTEGVYKIRAAHPQAEKAEEITLDLKPEQQYHQTITLQLRPGFLNRLEYEKEMEQYRINSVMRYSSLTFGILLAGYSAHHNQNALAAQEEKDREQSLMLNAPSKKQSLVHYEKSLQHAENVKESNRNMLTSGLLSLLFFGFSYLNWTDEPEKPADISFRPVIKSKNKYSLGFRVKW